MKTWNEEIYEFIYLWPHSFSIVTCSASRSRSIPPIAIKRCAHFWSDLIRIAHIENVICSRDCAPIHSKLCYFLMPAAYWWFAATRPSNEYVVFHNSFEKRTWNEKKLKWKMMIFVFEMLVVCRFVVVRLFHRECVSSGSGFDVATPVCHHEYFNFNFTSGFPVSTTPFVTHPTEFCIFFVFVCFHAHCGTACEWMSFFLTRNVMSQCANV